MIYYGIVVGILRVMKLYGIGDAWPTPDPPADRVLTLPLVEYQVRTRTSTAFTYAKKEPSKRKRKERKKERKRKRNIKAVYTGTGVQKEQ